MAIGISEFGWAVNAGLIPGCSPFVMIGKAPAISAVPITVGPANALLAYATAVESWEIVSSSANDAAAGTGARSVLVNYLDASFELQSALVSLNGLTAVPLAANCLRFNQATVASVGSDASKTNLGTLTVRVAGAGATRGYIAAGEGISRIASYTIPAGHRLFVQSQSVVQAKSGGQGTTIALASYATLASGAMLLASDNTYPEGVSDVTWPSGIRLQEKQTLEFRVNAISTSGIDVGILLVGILADLDNLAWFSPANALR